MKRRRGYVTVLVLAHLGGINWGFAAEHPQPAAESVPAVRTFDLINPLDSEFYEWPATLLSYPVTFPEGIRDAGAYSLVERTSSKRPLIQWSDIVTDDRGGWRSATLNVMTSLARGERKQFSLIRSDASSQWPGGMSIEEKSDHREISSSRISLRIPKSRRFVAGERVPGPFLAIATAGRWLGGSHFTGADGRIVSLESRIVERGPLFATAEISYEFADGGHYAVRLRVVDGYEHVEFSETMSGFAPEAPVALEIEWEGFNPTRRFAANGWKMPKGSLGIEEPVVTDGIVEEPHWFPPETVEDPSKVMIYTLASYQGNQPRNAVPVMSFWEQGADGLELSAFVGDSLRWREPGYSIWQPAGKLDVRFRFQNRKLVWSLPLATGERAIGIALHSVVHGENAVEAVRHSYRQAAKDNAKAFTGNVVYSIETMQLRYAQLLRSWYGALSLDKVKDWELEYSPNGRPPTDILRAGGLSGDSPDKFEKDLFLSALSMYPLGLNLAVMNISHRVVGSFLERYARLRPAFSDRQKRRIDALLLICAYVNASDELSPVRTSLAGAPNMAADGFCIPAEISAVFPDHPMGAHWRDQFEKTAELNGVFYTRPAVTTWNARGGRWAESMATYHWAQLLPLFTAQQLAASVDGRNRLASPELAERAEWLTGQLTAPVYNPNPEWRSGRAKRPPDLNTSWNAGDELDPRRGFERQIPARGAHSSGTTMVLPDTVAIMANSLRNYAPLAAEHLLWAHAQVRSTDKGEWVTTPLQQEALKELSRNRGTAPELQSTKFTGHGIVLRAGVGTPEELSVHLDQIDQGANYRWGNSGDGNSGTLSFFAGGKVWTGHETENTGDHTTEDTLGSTTFGVWKNGAYRSIGANSLKEPLFDVDVAQLATIKARTSPSAYAWPQYRSRSVMLVGTDYFILFDEASGPARFTWFNASDLELPELIFLEPSAARADHWFEVRTRMSHGILRDSSRDTQSSAVLVTHKRDAVKRADAVVKTPTFPQSNPMKETTPPRGAVPGVYLIQAPQSRDLVFRSVEPLVYSQQGVSFKGTAGVVRNRADGSVAMALLSGVHIGAKGVEFSFAEPDAAAISATVSRTGRISGRYDSPKETMLRVKGAASHLDFYVDGVPLPSSMTGDTREVTLPKGRHRWELTDVLPEPVAPAITGTHNVSRGASVTFNPVGSAEAYVAEISENDGETWKEGGRASGSPIHVTELMNGAKIHVRVRGINSDHVGVASAPYPIYVSDQPPAPPDGLRVWLTGGSATLSWGEVLGVSHYNLYRRSKVGGDWRLIYSGSLRSFVDQDPSIMAPRSLPDEPGAARDEKNLFEYVVRSVNGNGEGAPSVSGDTHPGSWRNWWPHDTPRKTKRVTGYWLPPYVKDDETGAEYYPQ